MRQGWNWRVLVGFAIVAALAAPAWGYINGGDFRTTDREGEKKLKSEGWSVGCSVPESGGRPQPDSVPGDGPDGPEYRRWVDQLVGRAVKDLPGKTGDAITTEAKREIARVARDAIHRATSRKRPVVEKGEIGTLQYQVGGYEFESYWETNYRKREIHEYRKGVVPFVAVKVTEALPKSASELPQRS